MFQQTKNYLLERMPAPPRLAVVLGSGLGGFADELTDRVESRIPTFRVGRVLRLSVMPASWCSVVSERSTWLFYPAGRTCTKVILLAA